MATARDIMTRNVVTIDGNATVADAVELMKEKKIRSLIVERRNEQDGYGIITYKDVAYKVVARGLDAYHVKVHEVMTKPVIVVTPNLNIKYVARLFANTGITRAPVIDGDKMIGFITISDILFDLRLVNQAL
jgi:CBS domain-containing protein